MWVLIPMGIVVAVLLLLDLIPKRRNDDPPKHIRQAWAAKRLARDWKGRDC